MVDLSEPPPPSQKKKKKKKIKAKMLYLVLCTLSPYKLIRQKNVKNSPLVKITTVWENQNFYERVLPNSSIDLDGI